MTDSHRECPAPTRRRALLAAAIGAAVLAACGSSEAPVDATAPTAAPQAPQATAPATSGDAAAGHIASVRLVPDLPLAGGDVTAEVELAGDGTQPVALRYEWRLGGETVDGRARSLRLPEDSKGSVIEVFVTVAGSPSAANAARATARVANRRPVIRAVALEPPGSPASGDDLTAIPDVEDADGDAVDYRFEWYVNDRMVSSGPSNTLTRDQTRRGDRVWVVATANDGESNSEPVQSETVTVANSDPKIVSMPGEIGVDGVFRYAVKTEDPDGDRVMRYRLTRGPEGMSIDPYSGAVEWAPGETQVGTHRVSIAVDDSHGGTASQEIEVRVALEEPATPASPAPE